MSAIDEIRLIVGRGADPGYTLWIGTQYDSGRAWCNLSPVERAHWANAEAALLATEPTTPTPPDPVAEAARETDRAWATLMPYCSKDTKAFFDAFLAEMRARAAKGAVGK